jgi:hypothetical protein
MLAFLPNGIALNGLLSQFLEAQQHGEHTLKLPIQVHPRTGRAVPAYRDRAPRRIALHEDTQAWWAEALAFGPDELDEDEEPATADVEGLRRFLEE